MTGEGWEGEGRGGEEGPKSPLKSNSVLFLFFSSLRMAHLLGWCRRRSGFTILRRYLEVPYSFVKFTVLLSCRIRSASDLRFEALCSFF